MKKALVLLIAIGAMSTSVFAKDIRITGEKCPLTVITDRAAYEAGLNQPEGAVEVNPETGEPVETAPTSETVKFKRFNLLGIVDDQYAVISYKKGAEKGFVPLDEIQEELPTLDWDSFNSVDNWSTITSGSASENVLRLQQNLTALGYLDGADGSYGTRTADAISHFRVDHGLESLYDADIFTFLMIAEAVDGDSGTIEIQYPVEQKVDTKYASIYKNVVNPEILADYLDRQWHLSYDVFEGKGTIENRGDEILGVYEDTARPIDTINIVLSRAVRLLRNDSGQIEVTPAVQVTSRGAYRPYVQSILLRNGSKVIELASFDSEGAVEGTDVVEKTFVELTDEAEEMLRDENTEIRVKGSSKTYDL